MTAAGEEITASRSPSTASFLPEMMQLKFDSRKIESVSRESFYIQDKANVRFLWKKKIHAYPETKAESRRITGYIENSPLKFKRLVRPG